MLPLKCTRLHGLEGRFTVVLKQPFSKPFDTLGKHGNKTSFKTSKRPRTHFNAAEPRRPKKAFRQVRVLAS